MAATRSENMADSVAQGWHPRRGWATDSSIPTPFGVAS